MTRDNLKVKMVASTVFEGGAEKYIAELARVLSKSGASVSLIGDLKTWPRELPQVSIKSGPKWSLRTLPVSMLRLPGEIIRLRRVAADCQGDVFNLHFKREQIAYTKYLSKRGRVVWTEHGRFPAGLFGRIIGNAYRRASRFADTVVCVSPLVAADISKRVTRQESVRVIDTAIDLAKFEVPSPEKRILLKESMGLDARAVVAYVGRLEDSKRPRLAIRAGLAAGAQVVVAGSGSQFESLTNEFAELADVKFLGHVDECASVYGAADVHVFSSNGAGEGFPTVILESAAVGVPTVAASDSGFGYAVNAAGGVEAEASEEALSSAIRSMLLTLENRRDDARRWAETRDQASWLRGYTSAFSSSI